MDKKSRTVRVEMDSGCLDFSSRLHELIDICLKNMSKGERCLIYSDDDTDQPTIEYTFVFDSEEKALWFLLNK